MGKHRSALRDPAGTLAAAFLLAVTALLALPSLYMLAGALWEGGRPTLAHLREAFSDPERPAELFANSAAVALVALAVSLPLGVPAGFLAFRTDLPLRRPLVLGAVLAACVPLYVTANAWDALCVGRLAGVAGAGLLTGVAYVPLVALLSGVSFSTTDADLEEAALLDGGRVAALRHAALPQAAWGIGAAAIVVVIFALSLRTVTDLLRVRAFAEEAFTQYQFSGRPWRAAAVSLPVAPLLFLLGFAAVTLLRRCGRATVAGGGRLARPWRLGRLRGALGLGCAVAASVFLLVPLGALARRVGGPGALSDAYTAIAPELWHTLRLSAVAATCCVILAAPLAWLLVRIAPLRHVAGALLVLLVATPAPLVGIGLLMLLNRPGLAGRVADSPLILILAYVIRTLPFAVLALLPSVRRLPRELLDAAALDGCDRTDTLLEVVLPLAWRGLIVAWFLAFVLCVAENGASVLVVPAGTTTLTVRFFTEIHYGLYRHAAGMCVILLGVVILPGAALAALLWRALRSRLA